MDREISEALSAVPSGALAVPALPEGEGIAFSLVVPTYNERHNLTELIARLKPHVISEVGDSYEIIVVDDNSPDRTWEIAAALAAADRHVLALNRTGERGLATAVVRGWQAARGRWLGVIDADLQHPPEVVAQLLAAMRQGADLAVASREAAGGGVSDWSLLRQLISRGSRALGRMLVPGSFESVSDPMTGYFVVRRTVLQNVLLAPCGYKILAELLVRFSFSNVVEVGYIFCSRRRDQSKASIKVFLDYIRHLFRLRAALRELRRTDRGSTSLKVPASARAHRP